MTDEIEWIVTEHARERMHVRHDDGRDFVAARFRPQDLGLDGLRLWLNESGEGIMVREDWGTGWASHTIVTALSVRQVESARTHTRKPFKSMPEYSGGREFVAPRASGHSQASNRWDVLRAMSVLNEPRRPASIAKECGISGDELGEMLVQLRSDGHVSKSGKSSWMITVNGHRKVMSR